MEIKIQNAALDDLPVLAEINRLAYTPETTAQIAFAHWPDEENMRVFFAARVKEKMLNADTQIFKAVDVATGTITGFVCWTLETGDEEKPGFGEPADQNATSHAIQQVPDFLNLDFVMTSGAQIETLKQLMKGSKHYCELHTQALHSCWLPPSRDLIDKYVFILTNHYARCVYIRGSTAISKERHRLTALTPLSIFRGQGWSSNLANFVPWK